ncbi:VOC family protein [Brevibacterium siliguriense]|uniref:VOC family protein n=1 Tax=Brevibacterium siliguriense TaxID=1136497 RepID=UPI000A4D53E6|nr:hypothetical protein [Brevibacterium siliguriense]
MSLFRTPQIVLFTRDDHGLEPVADGQHAAVILWTDDVSAGYERLIELGARPVKPPEPWFDRLLIAWVEDLDGASGSGRTERQVTKPLPQYRSHFDKELHCAVPDFNRYPGCPVRP